MFRRDRRRSSGRVSQTPGAHRSILRRALVIPALATMLAAAGCGGRTAIEEGDAVPTGPDLVIGASLELSGPGAPIGLVQQRALLTAIDKVNEAGIKVDGSRHQLRLVIRDNLGRPPDARDAARDLIRTDRAIAVIGGVTVNTAQAMAEVAEEMEVPLFAFAASDQVTQPTAKRRFTFTVAPRSADVAARIVQHVQSLDLDGRVSLFAATDPHGDAGVPAVQRAAQRAGIELERPVRFADSGRDLAERAREVAAQRPKVVIVWAALPGAGQVATALRQAGFRGDIVFDSGAGGEAAFAARYQDAVDGAYMIHPESLSLDSLSAHSSADLDRKDFYNRYTRTYGAFSGHAPYGADAIGLVAEALRRAGSVSGPLLRDALESGPVTGVAGLYNYSSSSHNGMESSTLAVYEVRRGDWFRTS